MREHIKYTLHAARDNKIILNHQFIVCNQIFFSKYPTEVKFQFCDNAAVVVNRLEKSWPSTGPEMLCLLDCNC